MNDGGRAVAPNEMDVLCGSGSTKAVHPGNKRFRLIVSKHYADYAAAASKTDKMKVSRQIMKDVVSTGSRFLKKNTGSHEWHVADLKVGKDKISHCLREIKNRRSRHAWVEHQPDPSPPRATGERQMTAHLTGQILYDAQAANQWSGRSEPVHSVSPFGMSPSTSTPELQRKGVQSQQEYKPNVSQQQQQQQQQCRSVANQQAMPNQQMQTAIAIHQPTSSSQPQYQALTNQYQPAINQPPGLLPMSNQQQQHYQPLPGQHFTVATMPIQQFAPVTYAPISSQQYTPVASRQPYVHTQLDGSSSVVLNGVPESYAIGWQQPQPTAAQNYLLADFASSFSKKQHTQSQDGASLTSLRYHRSSEKEAPWSRHHQEHAKVPAQEHHAQVPWTKAQTKAYPGAPTGHPDGSDSVAYSQWPPMVEQRAIDQQPLPSSDSCDGRWSTPSNEENLSNIFSDSESRSSNEQSRSSHEQSRSSHEQQNGVRSQPRTDTESPSSEENLSDGPNDTKKAKYVDRKHQTSQELHNEGHNEAQKQSRLTHYQHDTHRL